MSIPRRLSLGLVALLCLAAARPLGSDELGGLSEAFRRAQQMVGESRLRSGSSSSRPAGRNFDDYVHSSGEALRAAQAAAQRMAEVESQLADLNAASRAYFEQHTSPEERGSLSALMDVAMRLQRDARARQHELQTRVSELRARVLALRSQITALDLEAGELRATQQAMSVDLVELSRHASAMAERVATMENAVAQSSSLATELEAAADSARASYWRSVGDSFAQLQLGSPRDYTARVEPDAATTQRRVKRYSTAPVPVPQLYLPVSAAQPMVAAAASYAVPAAAASAAAARQTPAFAQAVDGWLGASRAVYLAQAEADDLLAGLQDTEAALTRRAEEIKNARAQTGSIRSAVEQAAAELNRQSQKVEMLQVRLPESLNRGLRALGQSLLWAHAQAGLETLLRGVSLHAELAAHFTWVVRSYTRLLDEDLPAALDLLGPSPSDEALERYDRLTHLTETYVADREISLVMARATSSERARVEPVESLEASAIYRNPKADVGRLAEETKAIWTATQTKSSVQNAFGHWKDHGAEFPEFHNAKEYVEGVRKFVSAPPSGVLQKTRAGGDILFYEPSTNTFAVRNSQGVPRTMFRPTNKIDYWNRQQ